MDGTDNEFQNNWDEQPLIPGNLNPGGGNNYDKEPGGISCYKCVGCPVEPFDPTKDVTATDTGCYVCSKTWDSGRILFSIEIFQIQNNDYSIPRWGILSASQNGNYQYR